MDEEWCFQIGSWNTRTMLQPRRKEEIEDARVDLNK
jgi:hypothetical protein